MTDRAALATIAALTAAPVRAFARAMASYESALDSFNYESADMARFYPKCSILPQDEFERRQRASAEAIYAWQRDCVATIVDIAGSYEAGMAACESHRCAPVKVGEYGYCACDLCHAVSDLAEAKKDERKSIWYASDVQKCWCSACNVRNAPTKPEAPKLDAPSRWDVLGEAGADW